MGGARLRQAAQGRRKAAPGGAGAAQGGAGAAQGGAGAAQGGAGAAQGRGCRPAAHQCGGGPAQTRDGSSLDSYSKDSYSKRFLADSTDSRVWGINFESNEFPLMLEIIKIYLLKLDS